MAKNNTQTMSLTAMLFCSLGRRCQRSSRNQRVWPRRHLRHSAHKEGLLPAGYPVSSGSGGRYVGRRRPAPPTAPRKSQLTSVTSAHNSCWYESWYFYQKKNKLQMKWVQKATDTVGTSYRLYSVTKFISCARSG